jgi:hypothetical protein
VVVLFQGEDTHRYRPSGLSVIFERMSPSEVHALIVEAASARLHRLTGPRRVQKEKSECS